MEEQKYFIDNNTKSKVNQRISNSEKLLIVNSNVCLKSKFEVVKYRKNATKTR